MALKLPWGLGQGRERSIELPELLWREGSSFNPVSFMRSNIGPAGQQEFKSLKHGFCRMAVPPS